MKPRRQTSSLRRRNAAILGVARQRALGKKIGPAYQLSIEQIKEVVRLRDEENLSFRQIEAATGLRRATIFTNYKRVKEEGLENAIKNIKAHASFAEAFYRENPAEAARARGDEREDGPADEEDGSQLYDPDDEC